MHACVVYSDGGEEEELDNDAEEGCKELLRRMGDETTNNLSLRKNGII